ncbi:MAG: metallophosphoesterase [Pseudomonadota bacterium]
MCTFRFLVIAICISCSLPGIAQAASTPAEQINASTNGGATPWTSLQPPDNPTDFYFAIVSDRTGGLRQGVFSKAVEKLNLLEPAFVVSVGDFIEGYSENPVQLNAEWDEFEGFIEGLETPFFYTPGNHDMSNALMADIWQQRFGPSFYHFVYKDVLFLSLNSELFGMVEDPDTAVPGPWLQEQQMEFVRKVLHEHEHARWTVVLVHQPLWDPAPNRQINPDWLIVEELLGTRNYTVFAGHYHRYAKTRRHNRSFITLATTGGVSPLRGAQWGEFDHVTLVKMTDPGLRIANLVLDGILDEDVSTQASLYRLDQLQHAVVAKPVLNDQANFTRGSFDIEVHNPLSTTLRVEGEVLEATNFQIDGLEPMDVGSGETASLSLAVWSQEPIPYKALQTTAVRWTLTSQASAEEAAPDTGRNALQVETVTPVLPLTAHRIGSIEDPIQVDGRLDEWPILSYQVNRQGDVASPATEADDISFSFEVKTGDDALYIAAAVVDDDIVATPDLLARLQDSVAISIDTRPDAQRNQNLPVVPAIVDGFYGKAVVQILAPRGSASDTFIEALDRWAEQVRSAVTESSTGYSLELAIPHSVLDKIAGKRWKHARIGIRAYDLDRDDPTIRTLHWQPYRYGNAPLTGSHAFIRRD